MKKHYITITRGSTFSPPLPDKSKHNSTSPLLHAERVNYNSQVFFLHQQDAKLKASPQIVVNTDNLCVLY